ncbi:hypothetical protein KUTeg_021249 [Tegillarca granosa]|uniref:Uncharacterized protein n=1 Tax=Tegillarca granosa TaxID=220873 RepID=A0ABQ9EFC4_TEGGR|nr:hypothetical protein KUTeg_021249 [Tegillarca granosa]
MSKEMGFSNKKRRKMDHKNQRSRQPFRHPSPTFTNYTTGDTSQREAHTVAALMLEEVPSGSNKTEGPNIVPRGDDAPTNRMWDPEINGMEGFRQREESNDISRETSELLTAGWRSGTQTAYNTCWRHWHSWFCEREVGPFQAPVEYVANFIFYLFNKGYEY